MPFRSILIANRGEIARRIMRTCRAHGIRTIAVYSAADRDAPHVAEADAAVEIGEPPPRSSYLHIDRILAAATATRAEAIHPGYGFLSERSDFAHACAAAGITFIGPDPPAIEAMGDKVRARQAMIAAGVPVVPGHDDVRSVAQALEAARVLGFPVMVKASAGGGGKGMRVVGSEAELPAAFEAAQREAAAAFGDDRVFLERAVVRARHVEIQILADRHGNVLHLGERDCSVQRRHQKVIEESPCPSPHMTPELRARMGEVAVRAARSVGYVGAGTVEFLFEEHEDGASFYFLEMNTRLQVEHPVTELVTGRDLVWDQIRVAAGEPLGFGQDDVVLRGHAIECRLYAEDPITFLPRPGRTRRVRWPELANVRVDAAVVDGTEVSSFYDPMIAKLSAWGRDRTDAITTLRTALREVLVLGVETNLALHRRIFDDAVFQGGVAVNTRYLEEHRERLAATADDLPRELSHAMAAAAVVFTREATRESVPDPDGGAWRRSARWRS